MSKNILEINEIADILFNKILEMEKEYVRDVNELTQKEIISKISECLEEIIKDYEDKKNNH